MGVPIPWVLRMPIFLSYSKLYGVNLKECERPLDSYGTFNAFFTRRLKPTVRPVSRPADSASLVSPCDCTVLACGNVDKNNRIRCVKGHSYPLGELLFGHRGRGLAASDIFHGTAVYYAVLYLSPADYHRFHSPGSLAFRSRTHVSGYLNPVRPSYLLTHAVILGT